MPVSTAEDPEASRITGCGRSVLRGLAPWVDTKRNRSLKATVLLLGRLEPSSGRFRLKKYLQLKEKAAMILNAREWTVIDTSIRLLKGRLDQLRRRRSNPQESWLARIEIERMERRIDELESEKRQYYASLSQSTPLPLPSTLQEIPDFLIQRRIRAGLTQEELGQRLGFAGRTIQRYEQTRFAGASFNRLLQIEYILRQVASEESVSRGNAVAAGLKRGSVQAGGSHFKL
jgi:hypothetical protein